MGCLLDSAAHARSRRRQGVALLWLILALPALLLFLVIVVEVGNLWLARLELEQSLEANALATVKQWAETNGREGTASARSLGNSFSIANPVRGTAVDLTAPTLNPACDGTLNFDANAINGNRIATDVNASGYNASGVLVLGGVRLPDQNGGSGEVIFNAHEEPNRLIGANLLVDISQGGPSDGNNRWGISFRTSSVAGLNDRLLVTRIDIEVDPDETGEIQFATPSDASPVATLSDNSAHKVGTQGQSQPDLFGWASPEAQITFTLCSASRLRIDFSSFASDSELDSGFAPGDRFRFETTVHASGMNELDADQLGQIGAKVYVYCSLDGEPWPEPLVGRLVDTDESGCATSPAWQPDHLKNLHWVVHPSGEFDLPCPPAMGTNNGQSYALIHSPEDPREYGVRAQASISVPSVCKSIGGIPLGPFGVTAGATAVYDPQQEEPKFIRPDQFLYTP